jgi:hypothetical protein
MPNAPQMLGRVTRAGDTVSGRRRSRGEGSVYREVDARRGERSIGAIVTPEGRRKVTGRTKRETLARLDRLRAQVRSGQPAPNRNTTVTEVVGLWRERELAGRQVVPAVRERYEWHCRIIVTELGGKRVARLTIADVERMLDALAERGSRTDGKGRPFGRATLGTLRATTNQILEFARAVSVVSDLDLSFAPPLSSPWDPVQTAAQTWMRAKHGQTPEQRSDDGG